MKKRPAKRASSAIPPQKKKPLAGILERKSRGVETVGGKEIPLVREQIFPSRSKTAYGHHDFDNPDKRPAVITILHKYEFLGRKSLWIADPKGKTGLRGPASNKLQALLGNTEAMRLFHAVVFLRQDHDACSWDEAQRVEESERDIIELILRDIASGGTHFTLMLATCIEAAVVRKKKTVTDKILEALTHEANRRDRIPTKAEVQKRYEASERDVVDEGNFSKALAAAGLAWLPIRL
jgi:hypothetical protein